MNCDEVVRALWDYLDGRCEPERHALIEEHLALCEDCRSHAEFEQKLSPELEVPGAGHRRRDMSPNMEFRRLTEVPLDDLVELFNHPAVRRHLPLATGQFTTATCASFVAEKERMWAANGYGPWAIFADGRFAGWGGLQPHGPDADLAIVLHPLFWGLGHTLVHEILRRGLRLAGHPSVIILLPRSRARVRTMRRLGFRRDGVTLIEGVPFLRFRSHVENAEVEAAFEGALTTLRGHERQARTMLDRVAPSSAETR